MTEKAARAGTLHSVANSARVLKSFNSNCQEWGVSDLARHLGLGKSTVHRLLSTLAAEGMLDQDPMTGRYHLGLAVFDMVTAVPRQMVLHEAVLSPMTELRNRTGETVHVGVLDNRHVVYVERLDSPNTIRTFQGIGRRNWVHSTATGKVLLAYLKPADLSLLLDDWAPPRLTSSTITDVKALRKQLVRVRRLGYAENREESEKGVWSIAAPIRDTSLTVIAALSVALSYDPADTNKLAVAQATVEAASAVTLRLGGRPN